MTTHAYAGGLIDMPNECENCKRLEALLSESHTLKAPISERARLVYEGAMRLAAADTTWDKYDDSGCTAPYAVSDPDWDRIRKNSYVSTAAEILAAAERAVKAPAPAEG